MSGSELIEQVTCSIPLAPMTDVAAIFFASGLPLVL
jgi:hypothetical protein